MKIRAFILPIIFAGIFVPGWCQQRPIQSLYMFDPLLINPAYAGTQIQLTSTAIYRNQWVNLDGAPRTFTATMHSGFYNAKMGLGVIIANDQIGIHNDASFYAIYSYKINLDRLTTLSMGIQGGFNNIRSDYNLLNLKSQNDPNLAGVITNFAPNVGAGLYLRRKTLYVGISTPQLINNAVYSQLRFGSASKQLRYYYVNAGFSRKLTNNITWIPSALLRFQEDAPLSFDINSTLVFYQSVGFGASYRIGYGFVGLFELQLNENFHVGYAYDFTTSELNQFSNGTHEIMINYRIKITKLHKGLPCPAYW